MQMTRISGGRIWSRLAFVAVSLQAWPRIQRLSAVPAMRSSPECFMDAAPLRGRQQAGKWRRLAELDAILVQCRDAGCDLRPRATQQRGPGPRPAGPRFVGTISRPAGEIASRDFEQLRIVVDFLRDQYVLRKASGVMNALRRIRGDRGNPGHDGFQPGRPPPRSHLSHPLRSGDGLAGGGPSAACRGATRRGRGALHLIIVTRYEYSDELPLEDPLGLRPQNTRHSPPGTGYWADRADPPGPAPIAA